MINSRQCYETILSMLRQLPKLRLNAVDADSARFFNLNKDFYFIIEVNDVKNIVKFTKVPTKFNQSIVLDCSDHGYEGLDQQAWKEILTGMDFL